MKVIAIVATTADGLIAKSAEHLADWTSTADKKLFVEITKKAGVIVMGRNTFNTIGRALPERRNIVYTREPLNTPGVEATTENPADLLKRLGSEGHKAVAIIGGQQIYNLFFAANLVDELYITIEPFLFGKGVNLLKDALEIKLKMLECRQLTEDAIMLHYRVVR